MSQLECIGVDVFVWSNGGIPKVPVEVGPLKMECISQRGLKCAPGPVPEGIIVDWFACRYMSTQILSDEAIKKLLDSLGGIVTWEKVQKLFRKDGVELFSKVYEA